MKNFLEDYGEFLVLSIAIVGWFMAFLYVGKYACNDWLDIMIESHL